MGPRPHPASPERGQRAPSTPSAKGRFMIRAAVIGYGYLGPNIVRNFKSCGAIDLACVCDMAPKQLELVNKAYPGLPTTGDLASVLADPSIDAVAIITPVASHFELGMAALRAGKHVWIEKPVTASSEE